MSEAKKQAPRKLLRPAALFGSKKIGLRARKGIAKEPRQRLMHSGASSRVCHPDGNEQKIPPVPSSSRRPLFSSPSSATTSISVLAAFSPANCAQGSLRLLASVNEPETLDAYTELFLRGAKALGARGHRHSFISKGSARQGDFPAL